MAYTKSKRFIKKARNFVRKTASKVVNARRKYKIVKKGKVSSMGVTKALANLSFKAGAAAEYKMLDQSHNTAGNPDTATRYFYRINAASTEATESTTTTLGTIGYLLRAINHPTQGDGLSNRDGMRYGVASIHWKGLVTLSNATNQMTTNGAVKLMIVAHLRPEDTFVMGNFLQVDTNGEYSMASRREEDHFSDFKVIASKIINLNLNSVTKKDFSIFVRPNKIVKILSSGAQNVTYYCVAVASPDVAATVTQIDYNGYTRMRFIN